MTTHQAHCAGLPGLHGMSHRPIIVIGGSIAGLQCAAALLEQQVEGDVILLEESDCVGAGSSWRGLSLQGECGESLVACVRGLYGAASTLAVTWLVLVRDTALPAGSA